MSRNIKFELDFKNMTNAIKALVFFLAISFTTQQVAAQYTETINTNNPGRSQGAFAVGTGVAQIEGSLFYRTDEHRLQNYERDYIGTSFQLRYGALSEKLEFSLFGTFDSVNQTDFNGPVFTETSFSNFSRFTFGAKYLVFDPLQVFGEKEASIRSWKANHSINWRDLIPAVSIYAGANFNFSDINLLIPPDVPAVTPRVELITQNNLGRWVVVTNFVVDYLTTDYLTYQWLLTTTHSLNNKWAVFAEYQGLKSDFYSDDLARGGVTYLINNDWQVDSSLTFNFKDTPTVFQVNLGMSYRIDFHKDAEIKQTKNGGKNGSGKGKKKKNKINLEEGENDRE